MTCLPWPLASGQPSPLNAAKLIHLALEDAEITTALDPGTQRDAWISSTAAALETTRSRDFFMVHVICCPYDPKAPRPTAETAPLATSSLIASASIESEKMVLTAIDKGQVQGVCLRLFDVYGPGQAQDSLIPSVLQQIKEQKCQQIEVKNALISRDFIYVDDAVSAIEAMALRGGSGVFNVATGVPTSLGELIGCAQKIAKTQKPIINTDNTAFLEPINNHGDIRKIASLGWHPLVELNEGLRRTWLSMMPAK